MSLPEISAIHITATHRVTAIMFLATALIVMALLVGSASFYPGIVLLMLVASLRGYTTIATLALMRLRVRIETRGRVEGENIEVVFVLENRSWIPIAIVEVSLSYSPHLKLIEGVRAGIAMIPPRSAIEYRAVFAGRVGRHRVGPLKAVVRDPLGLFRSRELELGYAVELRIAPRTSEAIIKKLLVHTRSTGITRAKEPGLGVEFHSVREYRPGDDIRRVDWKHFAATRRLVIKEMEREAFQSILFVLDATPPMFYGPYGTTPFEHTTRVIATIARYLSTRGDLMALLAYSARGVVTSGRMSRGSVGYGKILSTIANIEFDTSYIGDEERSWVLENALGKIVELLPRERNLVFLFTTAGGGAYFEAVTHALSKLRLLGNEVYAVIPISIAYEVRGLNRWAQAIYRVKTFEKMKQELDFAKQLRKRGIKTLALGPQYLPQTVIRIIESLRA